MNERSIADGAGPRWRSLIMFMAFMAIALFFLLSEHRIHVLGWLPLALLAACPLMHLFMHHGHGQGGHQSHGHVQPADRGTAQAEGEI
jgi:hypothetical protein